MKKVLSRMKIGKRNWKDGRDGDIDSNFSRKENWPGRGSFHKHSAAVPAIHESTHILALSHGSPSQRKMRHSLNRFNPNETARL